MSGQKKSNEKSLVDFVDNSATIDVSNADMVHVSRPKKARNQFNLIAYSRVGGNNIEERHIEIYLPENVSVEYRGDCLFASTSAR